MSPLSSQDIDRFHSEGFLVVASGATPAEMDRIKADILDLLAQEETRRAQDPVYQNMTRYRRFMLGLHLRSPAIRAYAQSDVFQAIGKALIGDDVDLFLTSTITKSPGKSSSIDWHQDDAYDPDKRFPRLLCWTSVTPSYPDNGGLYVIPGSHLKGPLAHEKSELYERDLQTVGIRSADAVPLTLNAGDVLAIHPYLVHGSPENQTQEDRIALICGYHTPKTDYSEIELKIRMPILRKQAP